jgi:hypothetical protein
VEGGLFLNVIVRKGASILELLAGEDETLLVRGDSLLILNLGLHGLDGVRALDFQGDGLSSQGLDEDLHTTTETKDQVKGGLLLNIIVRKGASILELLASEDEALLVRGDSLLILNLGLDRLNGVGALNF